MVAINRLSIEPLSTSGMPARIQYPSATPTSSPKEVSREEPPFSHLWKGLCAFFTSIFKPSEESSLAQKARILEEENMALKARLAEREESLERIEGLYEQQLKLGAKRIGDVLKAHGENKHTKWTEELQGIAALLQRHEVAVAEYLRYKQWYETCKQGYDTLEEKFIALKEHAGLLEQEMEELGAQKIEFEDRYLMERDKVALYEQALYEQALYRMGHDISSS